MNIRSKWIPEGHQGLLCYDGFYVDNHAVYRTEDVYSCWEDFTTRFIEQMKQQDSSCLLYTYRCV